MGSDLIYEITVSMRKCPTDASGDSWRLQRSAKVLLKVVGVNMPSSGYKEAKRSSSQEQKSHRQGRGNKVSIIHQQISQDTETEIFCLRT